MDSLIALFSQPATWVALATLIAMEVVLGIDNLVFVSILTNKLPEAVRPRARRIGIGLALGLRLALLGTVALIVKLTQPIFTLFDHGFSWRDLILIAGGLFLVWKSTTEIHHNVDPAAVADELEADAAPVGKAVTIGFAAAIGQIIMLDLVFSIDSIVTAVGMTPHIPVMVVAVIVAVLLMLLAAGPLSDFIARNPTVVMLALGFLLMIGMTLIAEGFGAHVEKGYVYAAMAFSAAVEGLNIWSRGARVRKARR
ncbi:TerC family protein [Glacieibacterium sp.]|uniref:TerC family protein n=1 Tax=Glacieibacterium sp. TaxID=2860237 RepID=UPI003B00725A